MPEKTEGRRTKWSWLVSGLLAAVLLYLSLRGVEWTRVWIIMKAARWEYMAASGLITCFTYFLRACRWRILLNAEHHFTVGVVFEANMAGYLGNNFLPARAGELIRTFLISSRSPLSKTYVLTTALAERMMDAVTLVLWSSVVLLSVEPKPRWLEDVSRATTLVAAAGALSIAVLPHTGALCEAIIRRLPIPAVWRERLLGVAEQVLSGLRVFHNVRRLAGFSFLTAVIWGVDAIGVMAGARAFDIQMTFAMAALLIAAMGLGSALPSTPGYVGIYQFAAVTVLVPFGVSKDAALAYILVLQAVFYVVVVALGLPAILRYRGWRAGVKDDTA